MAIGDSVSVVVSLAQAASPQTASLNTPMAAVYHTHYPARFKKYSGQGGAGLAQMITDGFKVTDAGYKEAAIICSQSPAPAFFGIGRRALPPLQSLTLTLTDGTIGDAYNLTIVGGQDGLSHAISYTIPANYGASVSGTVSVTNGSPSITFSGSQTMAAGDTLVFSSQPGVYYALSAAIIATTAGTLTANYQGTTNAAATATHLATLAGTANAVNGATNIPTTTSQVGAVAVGDSVMFVSQLNVFYTVAAVAAGALTLSTPYSGVTSATTHFSDVSTVAGAATAVEALIAALPNLGTVSVTGAVITISRTDGLLNDVQDWLSNGFFNIQLADVTADPGIATDLAAIYAANKLDWYGVVLDSNSEAEVRAAAAWVESTGQGGKFGFYNNSDYQNGSSSTTDVFSELQLSAYRKTHIEQNNEALLCFAGASNAAWALVKNPGSYVMAQNKSEPGVPIDTDITLPEAFGLVINDKTASSPTTLGKGGNFYRLTAGIDASFWGLTPSGLYADLIIFIDWLVVNMGADVFGVLAGVPKLPYDSIGFGKLFDAIDTRLQIGASAAYGGIDPSQPITVTLPNPQTVDQTDRAAGNVPNVTWTATYDNGIVTVEIAGTLVE